MMVILVIQAPSAQLSHALHLRNPLANPASKRWDLMLVESRMKPWEAQQASLAQTAGASQEPLQVVSPVLVQLGE